MALLPGNTPKRTRLTLLAIHPKGTMGGGHSPDTVGDGLDVPLVVVVPTAQSVDSFDVVTPTGAVLFGVDKAGNLKQGGVTASTRFAVQVTLTAAQIIAMYTTPVVIVPAQAAGIGIVVDAITVQVKPTATQFASGGIVALQYGVTAHGAGVLVHAGSIPAAVINAATGALTLLSPTAAANGLTVPTDGTTASGIYISNATGVFATGTGIAIVTVFGAYVTLQ